MQNWRIKIRWIKFYLKKNSHYFRWTFTGIFLLIFVLSIIRLVVFVKIRRSITLFEGYLWDLFNFLYNLICRLISSISFCAFAFIWCSFAYWVSLSDGLGIFDHEFSFLSGGGFGILLTGTSPFRDFTGSTSGNRDRGVWGVWTLDDIPLIGFV